MTALETKIGYTFSSYALCETALTHSSYYNENRFASREHNERLEFLGDSVLGFLAAEHLYGEHPKKTEGELTRMRAALVCESSLARAARDIGLSEALLLGKGEDNGGGRQRASLLADAMEALLAAIFLDGGMEAARRFALQFLLTDATPEQKDYKTSLQEVLQREPVRAYSYHLLDASGPDHAKVFTVEVLLGNTPIGRGVGSSKKEAEQLAAMAALAHLQND